MTTPVGTSVTEVQVAAVREPRAAVSWGAIVAGALIALAVMVLLTTVALAAGLEVAPVGEAADPRFGTLVSSIITGLFIVIAFGVGGLVAVWAANIVDNGLAVLHGFLVWALSVFLMLALVSLGAGAFGAAANVFGAAFEAATVDDFRAAGWTAVLALALGVGSAVLGGVLATREEISRVW
jgi:hypothetical protein